MPPKRSKNTVAKATRAASRARGKERSQRRISEQTAAARRNRETRAAGLATPWQQARGARRARRAEERNAAND